MAQVRFNLTKRILLQTTRQVTKKSGAAPMKSILSVTATQAMSLMTGSELNANSKSSLCSLKTGIAFSRSVTPAPRTEIDIRRMGPRLGSSCGPTTVGPERQGAHCIRIRPGQHGQKPLLDFVSRRRLLQPGTRRDGCRTGDAPARARSGQT